MRHFGIKIQKISGEGAQTFPVAEGTPLPKPHPLGPPFTNPGSALGPCNWVSIGAGSEETRMMWLGGRKSFKVGLAVLPTEEQ